MSNDSQFGENARKCLWGKGLGVDSWGNGLTDEGTDPKRGRNLAWRGFERRAWLWLDAKVLAIGPHRLVQVSDFLALSRRTGRGGAYNVRRRQRREDAIVLDPRASHSAGP